MNTETNKKLQQFLSVATAFLVLLAVVMAIVVYSSVRRDSRGVYENTIEARGTAFVYAVPDIGRITFGHSVESTEVAVAQAELDAVISNILSGLTDLSVNSEDVRQQSYNVYPRYEFRNNCVGERCVDRNRELVGYEVSQNFEIMVRDLSRAGEVLAFVGSQGATMIQGPFFEIEDISNFEKQAREQAIVNAQEDAKQLAGNLGVRLGKMIHFYENQDGDFPVMYGARDMVEVSMVKEEFDTVSVAEGQQKVEVSVSLLYSVR